MEHWHPNPDFFFQPGAGPVLDIGPYYITNLIQLIGPVKRVTALAATPQKQRTIANGPRNGEKVPVDTPTTIHSRAGVRERRGGHAERELGRLGPRPRADGALRREGHRLRARPELLRRHGELHRRRQAGEEAADLEPSVRRAEPEAQPGHDGELPHGGPGRHGAGDRGRPAASLLDGTRAARGRRDDGDPESCRDRQVRRHADELRAARGIRTRRTQGRCWRSRVRDSARSGSSRGARGSTRSWAPRRRRARMRAVLHAESAIPLPPSHRRRSRRRSARAGADRSRSRSRSVRRRASRSDERAAPCPSLCGSG